MSCHCRALALACIALSVSITDGSAADGCNERLVHSKSCPAPGVSCRRGHTKRAGSLPLEGVRRHLRTPTLHSKRRRRKAELAEGRRRGKPTRVEPCSSKFRFRAVWQASRTSGLDRLLSQLSSRRLTESSLLLALARPTPLRSVLGRSTATSRFTVSVTHQPSSRRTECDIAARHAPVKGTRAWPRASKPMAQATRQITSPTSSATSSDFLSGPIATPTGRPKETDSSGARKPHRMSRGEPAGRPFVKGTNTTL